MNARVPPCSRRDTRRVWLFALGMIVIGNLNVLVVPATLAGSWVGVLFGLGVLLLMAWYTRVPGHLSPAALGFTGLRSVPASLGTGVAIVYIGTAAAATAASLFAWLGVPLPVPAPPGDLNTISAAALLRRVVFFLPFDTALPEEVVFRGILYAELLRLRCSALRTVLLTAVAFTFWHGLLGWREADGALDQPAVEFGGYFLGGLLFPLPLVVTGQIVGCIVLHELADSVLMLVSHPLGEGLRRLLFGA